MIAGKIAFAAGAFVASFMSGVGLGGFTIGGFRQYEPVDIIAEMATQRHRDAFVQERLPQAPISHVCKGCDAKLYRDVDWNEVDQSYLTDDAPPEEGQWTVADDPAPVEPPAVDQSEGRDGTLAIYEAPVVITLDRPQG